MRILCSAFLLLFFAGCSGRTPVLGYRVVRSYPHDPSAFTQGLVFAGGALYESTGRRGQSSLRQVDLATGRVVKQRELAAGYFGEGVTVVGEKLVQISWESGKGWVCSLASLEVERTFEYEGQGWGITYDGRRLILSDGSCWLRFLDPVSFAETGVLEVHDERGPVTDLNELEYVLGEVYANVWRTERIARIDPATGRVLAWLDLGGLLSDDRRSGLESVLNGIAYDAEGDRLFVTGKNWPALFEIEVQPPPAR